MKVYLAGNSSAKAQVNILAEELKTHSSGLEICSSWHTFSNIPETPATASIFWVLDQAEIEECDVLVCHLSSSPMKGALVEIGMALARQLPVVLFGELNESCGSWMHHPSIVHCHNLDELESVLFLLSH